MLEYVEFFSKVMKDFAYDLVSHAVLLEGVTYGTLAIVANLINILSLNFLFRGRNIGQTKDNNNN